MNEKLVTYDQASETYYAAFSTAKPEEIPDVIVLALAEIRDVDAVDLPPIARTVETDALVALFSRPDGGNEDLSATFGYDGWDVTVEGSGRIAFERRRPES